MAQVARHSRCRDRASRSLVGTWCHRHPQGCPSGLVPLGARPHQRGLKGREVGSWGPSSCRLAGPTPETQEAPLSPAATSHSLRLQSAPRNPVGQWQAPVATSQEPPLRHPHSCSQPGPYRPGGHPAGRGAAAGAGAGGFPSVPEHSKAALVRPRHAPSSTPSDDGLPGDQGNWAQQDSRAPGWAWAALMLPAAGAVVARGT